MFLTQKPGLMTFYHCSDDLVVFDEPKMCPELISVTGTAVITLL